jgi:hypothetical protein
VDREPVRRKEREMYNEADRKAFNADRIAKEKAAEVAAWLSANPSVGVLNGGEYYVIHSGMMIAVEELSHIY